VQERLRLVFAKFRELRSAKAVMRYLRRGNLLLPVRPLRGPAPHEVVWRAASGRVGSVAVAPAEWSICLKDAHPAYIDWDEFMANQRQLADNVNHYDLGRPGAPRKGNALLQGIISCGRCARRMCLRYSGPHGNYPVYMCVADQSSAGLPRCQEVRALALDAEVERLILAALAPDRVALAVAALGEIEQEARLIERQWSLKRERARYEAERARRQYDAVEPENRLVARSLERVSEERLRRVDQVEQEHDAWHREQASAVSEDDRQAILALGEDVPRLWHAPSTTSAERKQIVRLVIKEVTLDQKRRRGYVDQSGLANRRAARPAHPPRPHPGNERRQLSAQTEQAAPASATSDRADGQPTPGLMSKGEKAPLRGAFRSHA